MEQNILPDFCTRRVLILGCGNRLFGDDGFGPAVADYLCTQYTVPDDVYVMDVGTAVRKLLFTLCLSTDLPQLVVLIDAVDKGKVPGELFELALDDMPLEKTDDFSLHQAPTSNLAKELKSKGVDVRVLACQVSRIPPTIEVGLSPPVSSAVISLSERIAEEYSFGRGPGVSTWRWGVRAWVEASF